MLLTQPTQNSSLMELRDGNKLIGMWEIALRSGRKSIPGSTLSFFVDRENAGKLYTLYHQKPDGSIESFITTADAQGVVSFYPINELSPFMLVKGSAFDPVLPKTGDKNGLGLWLGLAVIAMAELVIAKRKCNA